MKKFVMKEGLMEMFYKLRGKGGHPRRFSSLLALMICLSLVLSPVSVLADTILPEPTPAAAGDRPAVTPDTSWYNEDQDEESVRRQAAANYIQSGHFREAMNVLQSLSQRNGQWYYLSSMANMGLGNNVNALSDIREAVRLEPDNMQYQMLLQRMEGGGSWYREMQNPFGGMPTGGDDYCMKLCLANLACSLCCPGGGVFCC